MTNLFSHCILSEIYSPKSSHDKLMGWQQDELGIADERTCAAQSWWSSRDSQGAFPVSHCVIEREKDARELESTEISMMQPQRLCVPLGSIIKLSVGRRGLNTLQTERGRDVQPHMHPLTTSYFHSHEWGPHTDSPHCCQTVRAKTFHNTSSTQCREKVFLAFALSRTHREGRFCLQAARPWRGLERALEKERWVAFLRNLESSVILPSVLHVVSSSFYTMFAKLSTAKLVLLFVFQAVALSWCTFKSCCLLNDDGDQSSHKHGCVYKKGQHQLRQHYVNMTAII